MHAIDRFRAFSWIVAGVIVVIEVLVVFVTMMGAVNARTREIGVLRALGFRRRHVTGLILMEASAASLLAGALGYLAGMGVATCCCRFSALRGWPSSGRRPSPAGPWASPWRSAPWPRSPRRCTPVAWIHRRAPRPVNGTPS